MFDDQHNLWTNVFASVYDCSSQDAKVTWTKTLTKQHLKRRHYGYQVKSKKQRKCCLQTVWSGALDCLVHEGTIAPTASSRWHYGEKTTRLSGVTSGVSGVKSLRANGRLQCHTND